MADRDYVRLGSVCACEPDFRSLQRHPGVCLMCCAPFLSAVKVAKFCGDACRIRSGNERAKSKITRRCDTCATEFGVYSRNIERRWCRDECKPKALRGLFSCSFCGVEYRKKGRRPGEGEKYCSRACAGKDRTRVADALKFNAQPMCGYYAGMCQQCGSPHASRRPWSVCNRCSALEGPLKRRKAAYEAALAVHRAAAREKVCEECGAVFCPLYGSSMASLCMCCVPRRERMHKRIERSVRRARERGAEAERVDPFKVFDRDRWRCQLCGIKTPKTKRGTYQDDAPELDHIQPLSKGGAHSYSNTQCTCRACNQAKSDSPMGQTLLFGW